MSVSRPFTYAEAKMKVGIYEYDCVVLGFMSPGATGRGSPSSGA